jgi:hypothetical protein
MAMCREALFTAGYLGLVPSLSRYARESHGLGDEASRVVGAIGGGVIVGTLSHPFDTIKTCQQVTCARAQSAFFSFVACLGVEEQRRFAHL